MISIHQASGAVGTAAVQIGKSLGANVFGTAGTDEGIELVKQCGALQVLQIYFQKFLPSNFKLDVIQKVFNHTEDSYSQKLKEATGNVGFDVILENLANVNLNVDLQMLKRSMD